MLVETYLRRGRRGLERMLLDPKLRKWVEAVLFGLGGFLLSAGGLGGAPQPIAMGVICAMTGWKAMVMALGAMLGYPVFWGQQGLPGILWAAAAGLLASLLGKRKESRNQPFLIPAIAAFLTAVTELTFFLFLKDETPIVIRLLRIPIAGLTGMLFLQASCCRDPFTDWLCGGVVTLAISRVFLGPFGMGYLLGGLTAVTRAFPGAALAGLGMDVSRVTQIPMAAVMSLAYFLRLVPYDHRWQHYTSPGVAYLLVSAACGIWDTRPLPGLVLGSALGAIAPPQPNISRRRGATGAAQVQLELGAEVMVTMEQLLSQLEPPPIDRETLLQKAVSRACGNCTVRKHCRTCRELSVSLLQNPLEADCRKQGRLLPELRRAQEQLRLLTADRQRRREYQMAMEQQYHFLNAYLRKMADRLPRKASRPRAAFRIEVGARSREKQQANGDRCLAFPGMDCCFYILLCDGMGTGLGAAREGESAANFLRQLLRAGFPAEHSLQTINSLLALRGAAGAVTVDLAEVHLDTGIAVLYKWGAAPSYCLSRRGAEKIGTASAPPGISVEKIARKREKLSLRRGEVLMLLSDGVDGEGVLVHDLSPDLPPGELAAKVLERGCEGTQDDATVTAIRLRPINLATS